MQLFSKLYQKSLDWAQHKYAIYWLSVISFLESSILPYPPPDLILAPMALKQPDKAYHYALVCTLTSVLGGLAGYLLGEILLDFLQHFSLVQAGMIKTVKLWFDQYDLWFLVLAAFTPIPYKLATIMAGIMNMALLPFVLVSLLARGARYYLLVFIVKKLGDKADIWLKKNIDYLGYGLIVLVVLGIGYVD